MNFVNLLYCKCVRRNFFHVPEISIVSKKAMSDSKLYSLKHPMSGDSELIYYHMYCTVDKETSEELGTVRGIFLPDYISPPGLLQKTCPPPPGIQ